MLDAVQEALSELRGERALVLAGPGCGKTYILALRVFKANAMYGTGFEDMLCLTFTNRAAREMTERIMGLMGYVPPELFVGNMHRFCFRFLMKNNLVPAETGILDEEDENEILRENFGLVQIKDLANFRRAVVRVYEEEHDFPEHLRQRLSFSLSDRDYGRVKEYQEYKQRHMLVDFDEIILRVYEALSSEKGDMLEMSTYSWIQVDEVQDMTPIQLAIVHRLNSNAGYRPTCLFLGDEQQAIFTFTGAGGPALDKLKDECRGHIYRLHRNYRSPGELVELCNELAMRWLGIDKSLLPEASGETARKGEVDFKAVYSAPAATAREVARLMKEHPGESIGVLTHTNRQAEEASMALDAAGIDHIRLSRNDMFTQPAFKCMYSHLAVVMNRFRIGEWARLMFQTRAMRTLRGARQLCSGLIERGIAPDELLNPGTESHLEQFCRLTDPEGELTVVVLDTETTGLNVFEDDVVEIAAVKMRSGQIVEGSEFDLLLRTDRPLPRILGNGEANPLKEVYASGEPVEASEGLRAFAEYLEGADAVMGHNLDFDLPILRFNYRRRSCDGMVPEALGEGCEASDTLMVSRLAMPRRRSYRLGTTAELLGIDTGTAHLAIDDVRTTVGVAQALRPLCMAKLPDVRAARADRRVMRVGKILNEAYGHHYRRARALLEDCEESPSNSLLAEMTWVYDSFLSRGLVGEIERYDYLSRLIDEVIVDKAAEPRFREQLTRRLPELLSFNEGDLFTNGIITENVSVMTIHKAKGLEMDNVVVYNSGWSWGTITDRAKVLYVAFSRARRRLIVQWEGTADRIVESLRR